MTKDFPQHISVIERWTPEGGYRKIGDGPWKRIEPWGFVPFVSVSGLALPPEWAFEAWLTPREAGLKYPEEAGDNTYVHSKIDPPYLRKL